MKTTKYVRQRFKSRVSLLRMVQDVSLNKLITGLTVIILVVNTDLIVLAKELIPWRIMGNEIVLAHTLAFHLERRIYSS
ncbi:hypothetical protein HC931_23435 [Candidatus Gracilibacteria bacterium]|nr:hypothetical protein [Candidatus Gracilibacteria bacterium]